MGQTCEICAVTTLGVIRACSAAVERLAGPSQGKDHRSALSSHRPRPSGSRPLSADAIARLTPILALRLALGGGQLVALYLATHAIGAFVGFQVMADAEAPDTGEADDEEAEAEAEAAEAD